MAVTKAPARRRRRSLPAGIAVRNGILAALLATEYKRLLTKLEHVELKSGQIVYRADQEIEAVYFPEDAVVAMVEVTSDRRTVEVGIIGREGIVGINIFLGGIVTPNKAIVQLPGGAMRMKAKDLRKEVRFGSPLQRVLLDYTRTFLGVISQSVACCQHHNIEQRLARWLLTMNDYAGPGEFLMVQDSIATMLGVRRVSISEAAGKLQKAALISYRRGRIHVLDQPGTPAQLPTVVADWIGALSMKEFAERRVTVESTEVSSLKRRVDILRSAIDGYVAAGDATLKLQDTGAPNLAVCLKGRLDGSFFKRATPGLERLLKHTRASVTLRVDAFQAPQLEPFQLLLRRLARYGDRVHIVIDERLRALVPIDSSVFNLVLARSVD